MNNKIMDRATVVALVVVLNLVVVLGQVHVSLTNGMREGVLVTIHCLSKDDDLGVQTLSYNQTFEWHFEPNVLHTTLFHCGVSTENVKEFKFDAYMYIRDRRGCGTNCRWLIAVDGIFLWGWKANSWILKYSWH
ncbi:hypothetical protein LguiA_003843 [Lonicera macranthoides]